MPAIQEIIKPSIRVRRAPNAPEGVLRQLQYGMEEEGVPWEIEVGGETALALAWEAARSSRLEVGIGLDTQAVILHYSKLKQDAPLLHISVHSGEEAVRALGANAARLVKKLPLKALDGR